MGRHRPSLFPTIEGGQFTVCLTDNDSPLPRRIDTSQVAPAWAGQSAMDIMMVPMDWVGCCAIECGFCVDQTRGIVCQGPLKPTH